MKSYDIKCPVCGTINKSLYLEETNGWFICEKCENESQILAYADRVRLPVYTGEELAKKYASGRTA